MCDLLLELTGVEHRVTNAYHPQTNGLTERMNQTLKGSLIQVFNNRQDDWDQHVNKIMFSYRYVFVWEFLLHPITTLPLPHYYTLPLPHNYTLLLPHYYTLPLPNYYPSTTPFLSQSFLSLFIGHLARLLRDLHLSS